MFFLSGLGADGGHSTLNNGLFFQPLGPDLSCSARCWQVSAVRLSVRRAVGDVLGMDIMECCLNGLFSTAEDHVAATIPWTEGMPSGRWTAKLRFCFMYFLWHFTHDLFLEAASKATAAIGNKRWTAPTHPHGPYCSDIIINIIA